MPTRQSNAVLSRSGSVYVKTTGTQTEGPAESQRSGQVKSAIIQMHMTSELDKLGQTKLILLLLYDNNLQLHQYMSARFMSSFGWMYLSTPSRETRQKMQKMDSEMVPTFRTSLPEESNSGFSRHHEFKHQSITSTSFIEHFSLALAKAYPSPDPFASFAPCQ
uniref:Uncharacterized protein n=1 Tax=Oryza meridionalis TaxID=40149 RepID=A0A0E0CMZ1_9ORYZ